MIRGLLSIAAFSLLVAIIITVQSEVLHQGMHPLLLNLLIYGIGSAIYGVFLVFHDRSVFHFRSKKGLIYGFVASILISVVADLLVLYGLQRGQPITWSMLVGMIPLGTYVLTVSYLHERFYIGKLLAVLFSIIGAFLVLFVPGMGLDLKSGGLHFLIAILVYSLSNTMIQYVLSLITVQQLTILRLFSTAMVMSMIIGLLRPEIRDIPWQPVLVNCFGLVLVIVLANTIIRAHGASFFAVGGNLVPVFTILIAVIRTGFWPSWWQMLGCLVIVGSVLVFYSIKMSRKFHPRTL